MVVGRLLQAELREDARDVRLDGLVADDQCRGDRTAGATLGHERQHLPLPGRQVVEWVPFAAPPDEGGDHGRVDRGLPRPTRSTASSRSSMAATRSLSR